MTHYTTGEIAKACDVTVRTVQYYDTKGLLKPSALTEGGRRLYTEADLERLRVICFLKDLGFSLADIAHLLADENPKTMLQFLVEEQKQTLIAHIADNQSKLERLRTLKESIEHLSPDYFPDLDSSSFGVIATVMDTRKHLRTMHIWMLILGLLMDVAWIGGLVYGILFSVWWPFVAGLAFAIAAGCFISWFYYTHTAYICPEDKTIFRPPLKEVLFAAHTVRKGELRKLTCPTCGYKGYCLTISVPDTVPHRQGKTLIWSTGAPVSDSADSAAATAASNAADSDTSADTASKKRDAR